MSIWQFVRRVTASATSGAGGVVEAVRTLFGGDPELRRRVAFSVAMIALSAKMAKADGIVTHDEIHAFQQIFEIPFAERRNVARLYDLAKKDVAGFEAYAQRMAGLCGSGNRNCAILEDILDGLFHIAKADGLLHERESRFLHRVAQIFRIEESHFQSILARHANLGEADPWLILGVERGTSFDEVKRRYRQLVAANHPDKLLARGLPEEFIKIATTRIAAINAAYEMIERGLRVI
jgi:DnaJ like chaperone protein